MTQTVLILSMWTHFAAAMLLWGGASLFWGVPPQTGIDRAVRWLGLINLVAALGWFLAESAIAGDGWQDAVNPGFLWAMATDTRFGQVWGPHLVLAVVLTLWTFRRVGAGLVILTGCNLGSIGLTGHAVLPAGGWGLAHQALSVLHLLSGGFWIGALPFVLPLLRDEGHGRLLLRFSRWGHAAVALVILTGVGKTILIQTARPAFDPGLPWSVMLGVKVLAVAAMTLLALNNRYRLVPQGAAGLVNLRRGTVAEIALAAGVLLLVSLFATLSPFGHDS